MVIPLRSGRQNHPLGLGESGRRHGRDPPVLRRDPRAVTTAAPLRHRAGGAGSRTNSYLRTTTLPLGSQPNASPFCDHLRCRIVCARSGTYWLLGLQHAADNGLVAGSSPPGPTTQSCTNPEFPVSAEHSRFSALWGRLMVRSRSLRETKTVRKRIWPVLGNRPPPSGRLSRRQSWLASCLASGFVRGLRTGSN